MLKLSQDEVVFLLKSLIEHKEKLEKMEPYSKKLDDLKPYSDLIKKLVNYRNGTLNKRTRNPTGR
jgi:hypothetical protein